MRYEKYFEQTHISYITRHFSTLQIDLDFDCLKAVPVPVHYIFVGIPLDFKPFVKQLSSFLCELSPGNETSMYVSYMAQNQHTTNSG